MKHSWSGYTFLPEAGRAVYFPMLYFFVRAYWRSARHPRWSLRISLFGDCVNHAARWYYAVRELHEFDQYLDRFLQRRGRMRMLRQYITRERRYVRQFFQHDVYQEKTNAALVKMLQTFYTCIEDLIVAAGTLRYLDRAIVPALKTAYRQYSNSDALVACVSAGEESFALQEERAMLVLAVQLQRREVRATSAHAMTGIKKIWNRYRWSSCGYYNEQPKTMQAYRIELRQLLRKNAARALRAMQLRIQKDKRARHASLLLLRRRDRRLGVLAAQATVAKDEYRFAVSELIGRAGPLFTEIAERTGQSIDAIRELLPQEVANVLHGSSYPTALVRRRNRHAIALYGPGRRLQVLIGRAADVFQKRYLARDEHAASTLQGRAASPGVVRGTVRVVLGVHDFHKVKHGDILVCLNTSPEFMPVLRKVAGMIGEEGGLTAHVSVISRELGIPCVVAINHATQIFKDGDRVEVNATAGIVKKIQ